MYRAFVVLFLTEREVVISMQENVLCIDLQSCTEEKELKVAKVGFYNGNEFKEVDKLALDEMLGDNIFSTEWFEIYGHDLFKAYSDLGYFYISTKVSDKDKYKSLNTNLKGGRLVNERQIRVCYFEKLISRLRIYHKEGRSCKKIRMPLQSYLPKDDMMQLKEDVYSALQILGADYEIEFVPRTIAILQDKLSGMNIQQKVLFFQLKMIKRSVL